MGLINLIDSSTEQRAKSENVDPSSRNHRKDTVPQGHVVLKNRVPLLQDDLIPTGASLGCDQLLKVPDGVISVALYADLLPQTVVANNLDHPAWSFPAGRLKFGLVSCRPSKAGSPTAFSDSGPLDLASSPRIAGNQPTPQPPSLQAREEPREAEVEVRGTGRPAPSPFNTWLSKS